MPAIARQIFKGVSTVVSGVQEIEVTNNLVLARVVLENLPFADVVAETNPEKIRRQRIEFEYRIKELMAFDGSLANISELASSWAAESS